MPPSLQSQGCRSGYHQVAIQKRFLDFGSPAAALPPPIAARYRRKKARLAPRFRARFQLLTFDSRLPKVPK